MKKKLTLIFFATFSLMIAVVICATIAYGLGRLDGESSIKNHRYRIEHDMIKSIIERNPEFSGLAIEQDEIDGSAYFAGGLGDTKELDKLKSIVVSKFGEARVRNVVQGVTVLH